MMDRILKRPMFRMGGRSDDGIMSVRPKYQEGGDVGFFTKLWMLLILHQEKLFQEYKKLMNLDYLLFKNL
jgi:hypothetical protein